MEDKRKRKQQRVTRSSPAPKRASIPTLVGTLRLSLYTMRSKLEFIVTELPTLNADPARKKARCQDRSELSVVAGVGRDARDRRIRGKAVRRIVGKGDSAARPRGVVDQRRSEEIPLDGG